MISHIDFHRRKFHVSCFETISPFAYPNYLNYPRMFNLACLLLYFPGIHILHDLYLLWLTCTYLGRYCDYCIYINSCDYVMVVMIHDLVKIQFISSFPEVWLDRSTSMIGPVDFMDKIKVSFLDLHVGYTCRQSYDMCSWYHEHFPPGLQAHVEIKFGHLSLCLLPCVSLEVNNHSRKSRGRNTHGTEYIAFSLTIFFF